MRLYLLSQYASPVVMNMTTATKELTIRAKRILAPLRFFRTSGSIVPQSGGCMHDLNRTRTLLLGLIAAMLVSIPVFSQTDFSGEWSVKNHEDCLTNSCQ